MVVRLGKNAVPIETRMQQRTRYNEMDCIILVELCATLIVKGKEEDAGGVEQTSCRSTQEKERRSKANHQAIKDPHPPDWFARTSHQKKELKL